MAKTKQKVSGCLPTLTGAQDFAAMRSYLATATKHGRRPFDVRAASKSVMAALTWASAR
jgi:transposase